MLNEKQHTKLNVFRLHKQHDGESLFYIKMFLINSEAINM